MEEQQYPNVYRVFRNKINIDRFNILQERLRDFHPERTNNRDIIIIKKLIDKIIDTAMNLEHKGQEGEVDRVFDDFASLFDREFSDFLSDIYMIPKEECYTGEQLTEEQLTECANYIKEILTNPKFNDSIHKILGSKELYDSLHSGGKKQKFNHKLRLSKRYSHKSKKFRKYKKTIKSRKSRK